MFLVRPLKAIPQLLRQHRKVAIVAFAFTVVAALAAAALWPKQYTGSAIIALGPGADQHDQHQEIASLLQQLPAEQDLTSIVNQYQLYPELVTSNGVQQADEYFLSRVSIREMGTEDGGEQVRLAYSGSDRDMVLGVTDALAQSFTRPIAKPAEEAATPAADSTASSAAPSTLMTGVSTPPPMDGENAAAQTAVAPPKPATTQAAPALKQRLGGRRFRQHLAAKRHRDPAAIQRKLDAARSTQSGLLAAQKQNTATLAQLKTDQAKLAALAVPHEERPAPQERRPSIEEERLRQQLTDAKKRLADLRERYTEVYPDVIATKERVEELQTQLNRVVAATPPPAPAPQKPAPNNAAALAAVNSGLAQAQTAQANLEDEIERNRMDIARLEDQLAQAKSAAASDSQEVLLPTETALPAITQPPVNATITAAPTTAASIPQAAATASAAAFVIIEPATVHIDPVYLNREFLWPISAFLGFLAAMIAAYIAERRDPSIQNEGMLRHEIPPSAVYLGGVPRIRHEVIVE